MSKRAVAEIFVTLLRPGSVVVLAGVLPLLGLAFLTYYGSVVIASLEQYPAFVPAIILVVACGPLTGFALLPTHAISLMAGWFCGIVAGSVTALLAIMHGALLGYLASRRISGPGITRMISDHPKWNLIHEEVLKSSPALLTSLIALMRLSPLAPFAATNVIFASIHTPLRSFILGSLVGLAPRVIMVVLLGSSLSSFEWSNPSTPGFAISATAITLGTILALGWYAKVRLKNLLREHSY